MPIVTAVCWRWPGLPVSCSVVSVRPGQPPKPGLSCAEAESGIYETTRSDLDSQAERDIQPRHVSVQVPTCMRVEPGGQLRVPHLAEQRVRSGACTSYWLPAI